MGEFNLIDQPWIPCITPEGGEIECGIRDTLLKAHELREICDDSPLVTVAIHRLLLAILYRAHGGALNFTGWKEIYRHKIFKQEILDNYLDKWNKREHRFNLFDSKYPFFQMSGLETKKAISINRLATECASGNNATLFDHSSDEKEVYWPLTKSTRQLLACQSFALGFGKSGNAKIDGKDEVLPYSADAIALRGMTVWAQGSNLFDTLMVNLNYSDDTSIPPWELDEPHLHRDKFIGKQRKVIKSSGTVDRLTWQSRLVRFVPNGTSVSHMYFTQGRSADKSPNDPMKVYRASKETGISAVSLSSSKAAWRDAHSILLIAHEGSNERRPECFNTIARASFENLIGSNRYFYAHVVGLATAPKKAGKFLLWRHERLPLSSALLGNNTLIEHLGVLLQNAEHAAIVLNSKTRRIAKLYLAPNCESPGEQQPDKDEVTKIVDSIDPRPAYWARLEKHFFDLLENLPGDWDKAAECLKPNDQQKATRAWREVIKQEGRRAISESVSSLGTTARAICAIAQVRLDFNDDDLTSQPQKQKTIKWKTKSAGKGGKKK